jgi:hypothetical protein
MKLFVLTMMTGAVLFSMSGCEKTEYKHPLHRAQGK